MKLNRSARNILSITAFAWSIPFAQAGDVLQPETESRRERASSLSLSQDAVSTDAVSTDAVSTDRGAGGTSGPAGCEVVRRFRRVP